MKRVEAFCYILILTALFVPPCQPKSKQRKTIAVEKFKALMTSEEFKAGIPDGFGTIGAIAQLTQIDYERPYPEVLKDVGDALVPLLVNGLAMIPVLGPVMAGVMNGVWSLVSPLFGGKSPMDVFVDNLNEKLKHLSDRINLLIEKFPKFVTSQLHEKLSSVAGKVISGEFNRDKYICSKYSALSRQLSEDLQNNRTIQDSLRIEMIALIHDCDNFLKDTLEGFVYPEYAHVFWAPSVVASLMRLSFLAEVSNWGPILNMSQHGILLFWKEMKDNIKRQFLFAKDAVKLRLNDNSLARARNFTSTEYEACRIQKLLLYFDRQMYPYGMPKLFLASHEDAELNVADYNVTENNQTHHIQIFYNDMSNGEIKSMGTLIVLNCIAGLSEISRMPELNMTFRIIFLPNKIYQIRVLYFTIDHAYIGPRLIDGFTIMPAEILTSNRSVRFHEENESTFRIQISEGDPNANASQRFLVKTALYVMPHPLYGNLAPFGKGYSGTYVVETVAALNVTSEDLSAKIIIENADEGYEEIIIFGAELIIIPPEVCKI